MRISIWLKKKLINQEEMKKKLIRTEKKKKLNCKRCRGRRQREREWKRRENRTRKISWAMMIENIKKKNNLEGKDNNILSKKDDVAERNLMKRSTMV